LRSNRPGTFTIFSELRVRLAPDGKEDPVLQLVLLRFQEHVTEESEIYAQFCEAVAAMDSSSQAASASLNSLGHGVHGKEDFLKELGAPDGSCGVTHVLTIAADSPAAVKELMSSTAYKAWLKLELPHLMKDGAPAALSFFTPLKVSIL